MAKQRCRKSTGIELEVKAQVPLLDYATNYSYQKTTGVDEGLAANIHPPHRFNLGARYSFSQDKTVNLNLSYFSEPDREVADTRDPVDDKTMVSLTFNAKDVYDSWMLSCAFKICLMRMLGPDREG